MSEELELAIREQTASEEELIARVRRAYGMSENTAIEHIGFVRGENQDDVVAVHRPTASSSSSP